MEYDATFGDVGYWGIATPSGYDASQFSEICFWVYAKMDFQSFTVNVKDAVGVERPSAPLVAKSDNWTQFCIPLSQYEILGVQLDRLNNINVHFEQPGGDAVIWVDDFEFR
jgi:hypothetical protein